MAAATVTTGRVLVTRRLPASALAKLQGLELVYHDDDEPMPAEEVLKAAEGGLDGIYCLLSDSISAEVVKAAGELRNSPTRLALGTPHFALVHRPSIESGGNHECRIQSY